jgi:hypothetical protein
MPSYPNKRDTVGPSSTAEWVGRFGSLEGPRLGKGGGPGFRARSAPGWRALGRRRIGVEVIRAQYRRKNLAEIDELRLQAFDLEANSASAGEDQRHDAGRRIALDEFDREHIEHGVFVRLIEASTLAGVDALEPQRRPAASVIRRVLGVF